ncbi:glycosyltransferase family 1 protein [Chryseobacterium indologenes]|uniref:Glycosyltransferase family 1 protein n=1 Tax=Chryseobacterium indologenes TaxID=253 RepID=A0A411DJP2_CHRID|nr:glycosyltransferase family 1 protein [Chryseobacterium indologenes]
MKRCKIWENSKLKKLKSKPKFFIVTTVSDSLIFFKGQLNVLKEEFDISLVCNPGNNLDEMTKEYKVKGYGIKMKREISLVNDCISLINLIFLFLKNKPDLVHANTPKGSLLSIIASWITRVPVRVYYIHGLRYQGVTGNKRKLLVLMEKITCFLATDILVVSNGVKEQVKIDKLTNKNIRLIWNGSINGIDLDDFNSEEIKEADVEGISKDDFVFGFIGRLVKDKGIEELISAFLSLRESISNTKLLVLGNFEGDETLNKKVIENIKTHPDIIYQGFQKDIKPYLKLMDIFVLPSYREGFGVALAEASAMKIPCITTNVLGCSEVIINEKTGYIIPSRDYESLFQVMKCVTQNKENLKTMGEAGRKNVQKKYEQKQLWEKSKEEYLKIISGKNV